MNFTSAHAAALWSGLLLILLLVLSVLVVRQRRKHRVAVGHGDAPELLQAMRAFENATEYVPAGIGALAVMAAAEAAPLVVHLTGLLLFVGRVIHAVALSRSTSATLGRSLGMILTWTSYVFAAVALVFYGIV